MSGKFINNPAVLVPQPRAATPPQLEPTPTTQTTSVYLWDLQKSSTESSIPNYSQSMPRIHPSDSFRDEYIVNLVDGRKLVSAYDYKHAGGRFRAVVKLFLLFEGQIGPNVTENEATWATATGWLAARDVVITAGHCAYDHSQGLGRLIKAKAYIGYSGKDSIGTAETEFRLGASVATTEKWVNTSGGHEPSDIAFIKLRSAFDSVDGWFNCVQTPISQTGADLGVVGYPGDIMNDKGERGADMYQMFKMTDYSLESSDSHMLQYKIDTYGGNSGSPVFNTQAARNVIGVHVLGGYAVNSASVIDGPYGNRVHAFLNIMSSLNGMLPISAANPPGASIQDPTQKSWLWSLYSTTTESIEDSVRAGLNITKKAAASIESDIPNTILDSDTPISFGKAGPHMGILAAAAITAAGSLAADAKKESDVEALANTRSYDGILARAILAEAALQHYNTLLPDEQETFTESLGPIVAALKPFVVRVAPRLLKGIFEPSIRLLLSNMVSDLDTKRKRKNRTVAAESDTGFGRTLSPAESSFLNALIKDIQTRPTTAESFLSTLTTIGDVVGSAFKKTGPILLNVAKLGLSLLQGVSTGESQMESQSILDPLAHRAILAEACLQAFIALPDGNEFKEGCFSRIVDNVAKFGPKVVRTTPFIVKIMGPVVADVLRQINSQKVQ